MKTQLIQLDASDDVISVRDKMGWGQTNRILLVWPENGQVFNRRLDLLLLQRHSIRLGAQLALVTKSPLIREIAQELNLPVFESSRQAQTAHWRSKRRLSRHLRAHKQLPSTINLRQQSLDRNPGLKMHPIIRYGVFGLSILAILTLVLFFLPAATISLQPETKSQTVSLQVTASTKYSTINLAGQIPAQTQRVVVEGRSILPVSGSIMIPGEPATGKVTFTNLTSEPVSVPKGQIVKTLGANPLRFYTVEPGIVPAGAGRRLSLSVQAMIPGETGNLPPGSLVAVEGEIGLRLSASNLYSTRGGTDFPAPAPTDTNRQQILRQLTRTLLNSALTDLQNSLREGDLLIPTTLKLVETLEETYSPPVGLPGDQLALTLRLEYQAMVISRENLIALTEPVMDGSLPEGFKPLDGTLSLAHTKFSFPNEVGEVTWTVDAQRSLIAEISSGEAIRLALGMPLRDAIDHLMDTLRLSGTPQIELSPPWWPSLPYVPFRIKVISE